MSQNDTKANSSSSESTISDGVHVSKQKIKQQQQHSTVKKSLATDIIHWKAHVRLGGKTAQGFTSVRVNKSTYHVNCHLRSFFIVRRLGVVRLSILVVLRRVLE